MKVGIKSCKACEGRGYYEICHKGPHNERYWAKHHCQDCVQYVADRYQKKLLAGIKKLEALKG